MSKSFIHRNADSILVGFVADTSGSMLDNRGDEHLRGGMRSFATSILELPLIAAQTELCILGFGRNRTVEVFTPFTPVSEFTVPTFNSSMGTYIYEAYATGVALIEQRKREIREKEDREVRAAWLLFASDFQATSPDIDKRPLAMQAKEFATKAKINVFILTCGDNADEVVAGTLAQDGRPPVPLPAVDFDFFFGSWLPKSMMVHSVSQGQRSVVLPPYKGITLRVE